MCDLENRGRRNPVAEHVFDITAYGAVDDPIVSSADAFRRAIADCQKAGGGIVRVPAGHYLTGPIDMVDNMTLHVDEGAVVLFETDRAKYPDITSRWEGLTENGPHPLLFANGLHNIAITGPGTFDGQGPAWWATMDMAEHGNARPDRPIRRRPMMVQIKDCNNVRIDGPTFINSPFWAIHLLYSENIDVGNCKIINPPTSPNTDALNTDSCRHVVVHDCFADVGDDAFGIKSGRDEEGRKMNRPTEDVTYIRCHVAHAHSVCAIGSEESGSVRHVRFLDCDGDGTDNGIRLKSTRGRGGIVEDVVASNIHLKNVRNAIILSLRYVKTEPEPLSERTPVPQYPHRARHRRQLPELLRHRRTGRTTHPKRHPHRSRSLRHERRHLLLCQGCHLQERPHRRRNELIRGRSFGEHPADRLERNHPRSRHPVATSKSAKPRIQVWPR